MFLKPHYFLRPAQGVRRLWRTRHRLPPTAEVDLPWGVRMEVDPREEIGRSIWQLGVYDLAVSETLWRLLEPGDLALDVGANIGHMTGLMAAGAGPGGEVLALEPHPQVFAALERNLARFRSHARLARVRAYEVALSHTSGPATLYCGPHFAANRGLASLRPQRGPTLAVRATTLDEVLDSRTAAVVKIDVEGSEADVLLGGGRALQEGRLRHVVFEASALGVRPVAEVLRGHGYTVYAIGRSAWGPLLSAPEGGARLPPYEASSFLATLAPESATARLRARGWRVLYNLAKHER